MRIVVAMSGGVDSSVAAALLAQQGHDVIGLSMQLYDQSGGETTFGSCCTLDDLHDARRVAAQLGIPHYIVNFQQKFNDTVVSDFVREYGAGRTPIPCVHCNGDLKFATLVERAASFDAPFVATGHYARVATDPETGLKRLLRGVDPNKDQSYFLFTLTQAQLAHAVFPVGELDKPAVREQARALGLAVADKKDSHEICFVAKGDHAEFLEGRGVSRSEGLIRDVEGKVVGQHTGVHRFTVGQRKGLGVASAIPLYVVGIDAAENAVTVGPRTALDRYELSASGVNWISGTPPSPGSRVTAQIRHRHKEAAATITPVGSDRVTLVFDEAQAAVAPGQALVMYRGNEVVGGGWID
jgi:tRNA-specific 2-thiouridylase